MRMGGLQLARGCPFARVERRCRASSTICSPTSLREPAARSKPGEVALQTAYVGDGYADDREDAHDTTSDDSGEDELPVALPLPRDPFRVN